MRRSSDFQRLRAIGKKIVTPEFVLQWAQGSTPGARIGVIVSKKVGNAVKRNAVRRRLREAFRRNRPEASVDLVCIARPASVAASQAQIVNTLSRVLEVVKRTSGEG